MAQSRQSHGNVVEKMSEEFVSPSVYRGFYEAYAAGAPELDPAEEARIEETLGHLPADCTSALDVGCGIGRLLSRLERSFFCAGVDISFEALKRSSVKNLCTQGLIQSLPFPSGAFDAVVCTEVLEHIPEDLFPAAIAELRRVARKYILVSIPNRENLLEKTVSCHACGLTFHRYGHLRSFNPDNLAKLFHPHFHLEECWEMGSPEAIWNPSLLRVRTLAGTESVNTVSPCPVCGNNQAEAATGLNRLVHRGCDFLQWRVASRWHQQPYWLGALYRVANNV